MSSGFTHRAPRLRSAGMGQRSTIKRASRSRRAPPLGIFQGEEGSDSVAQPFHALAGKQGHLGTALGTAPLVALGQRAGVEGQGA